MDATLTAAPDQGIARPTDLQMLVAGALAGFGLQFIYLQAVLIGRVVMPLPVLSVVSLLLAAVVAGRPLGGWRWTPLLAAAWGLVLLLGKLDLALYELAHPENLHQFAWQLVMIALVVVALVCGIGATLQNYRRPATRQLPRWVRPGAAVLAGLLVGAVAAAAIPRAAGGATVAPSALAQLPVVPLDAFSGGEVRVRAGQLAALRLANPDAVGHSFDVDELGVHAAMPGGGEGLALFVAEQPGTYTFYCAPHYDKASGAGMHGTLIVEP